MRWNRQICLVAVICVHGAGAAKGPAQMRATDVTVPLFNANDATPYASIHVESIRSGHQRRGFFRIGVLPELNLDGVELRLKHRHDLRAALRNLPARLPAHGDRALHMRNLRVVLFGEDKPALEASEATFSRALVKLTLVKSPAWAGALPIATISLDEIKGATTGVAEKESTWLTEFCRGDK